MEFSSKYLTCYVDMDKQYDFVYFSSLNQACYIPDEQGLALCLESGVKGNIQDIYFVFQNSIKPFDFMSNIHSNQARFHNINEKRWSGEEFEGSKEYIVDNRFSIKRVENMYSWDYILLLRDQEIVDESSHKDANGKERKETIIWIKDIEFFLFSVTKSGFCNNSSAEISYNNITSLELQAYNLEKERHQYEWKSPESKALVKLLQKMDDKISKRKRSGYYTLYKYGSYAYYSFHNLKTEKSLTKEQYNEFLQKKLQDINKKTEIERKDLVAQLHN